MSIFGKTTAPNRRALRKQLDDCAKHEQRVRLGQAAITATDAKINQAVDEHSEAAAKIQARLAATDDDGERQRLLHELGILNSALEARCASLRAQLAVQQSDVLTSIWSGPNRNTIEHDLIATAPESLQQRAWKLELDFRWAEARRADARRRLRGFAASEPDHVLWEAELARCTAEVDALHAEQREVRARMLNE